MTPGQISFLELVRDLIPFLLQEGLETGDVVARIGAVAHNPGNPLPIELTPRLPHVQAAQLTRLPDSEIPFVLVLEPAADSRPAAGDLKALLGQYNVPLTRHELRRRLVFPTVPGGPGWQVVVSAEADALAADIDRTVATRIAFRRDPPLEATV
jgi:hypothetical protein